SGFLLTTTRGWRVWALFGLWLAGRVAIAVTLATPGVAGAALDLAYLPALALLRDPPFWRRPKWPTAGFPALLLALAAAELAVELIALMIAVIAGRLVPGYTRAMLIPLRAPRHAGLEAASVAALLLLIAADTAGW